MLDRWNTANTGSSALRPANECSPRPLPKHCAELFRDGVGHATDRSRLSWNPTKYKIYGFSTNSASEEAKGVIRQNWTLLLCSEIIYKIFRINMF
jgi:hypothetical protein